MPNRNVSVFSRALPPLAALLLLALPNHALAQSEPTGMQRFFDAIGLIELPKDSIDYRERAPLVVPPSPALIPPRSADDMRTLNPDWPVDHDNRRASPQQIEAMKRTEKEFYEGNPLGPARLNEGTKRGARNNEYAGQSSDEQDRDMNSLGPARLGFRGWGSKQEERVIFRGEPERRALTDPPVGLRTPSADAPYGVVSTKSKSTKTVLDRSASPDDPALRK